jgi:hypothetical protein
MIKIQSYGPVPSWYQVDQSYNLPSFTGAVQWNGNTKCFEVSNGTSWTRIDNTVQVQHSADLQKIIAWANIKMSEEEKMQNLRSKYPALDEAYNHLELIKSLVTAGTETNDIQQN